MPFVEITCGVVAGGGPRKPGEQLELSHAEARLLAGIGRARLIDNPAPLPVVLAEEPPVKPQRKAPKAKKTEAAPAASANCSIPAPQELSSDASPAAD